MHPIPEILIGAKAAKLAGKVQSDRIAQISNGDHDRAVAQSSGQAGLLKECHDQRFLWLAHCTSQTLSVLNKSSIVYHVSDVNIWLYKLVLVQYEQEV
jgi:hypothetical protein